MGAYGAALYSQIMAKRNDLKMSGIISNEELDALTHTVKNVRCNGCTNHCALTVNVFADGQRLIAGNKCEKPTLRAGAKQEALPDLYKVKNDLLRSYRGRYHHEKKIGIPLVLNMYDLLPFWVEFFHQLGYETLISPSGWGIVPPIFVMSPRFGAMRTVRNAGDALSMPSRMRKNSMFGLAPQAWQSEREVFTSEVSAQVVSPFAMFSRHLSSHFR